MSFQQSTATALPAEVQLAKEKPQGAFCLRTRYALSANSANSWLAGSLVSLPLQTGTPGTFTDVKQGNINCTLLISNTNPYVDYLNFGPCGAMIFFDEMRVYSSGTPVEENLRYSETVDLLMEQGGWQCRPLHIFRRNKWRANNGKAGDKHINFIKPAMVDATGVPMFGRTPFMDKNSAVYTPASISFGYQPTAVAYANAVFDLGLQTVSKSNGTTVTFGAMMGTDSGYTFNDDGYGASIASSAARPLIYDYSSGGQGITAQTLVAGRNSTHVRPDPAGNQLQAGDHLGWKNTSVGRTETLGSTEVTYPWIPCATYVPSQWPDFQPCTLSGEVDDFEVDQIIGKTKVAEYMKYLANVRSLPIGLSGHISGTSYCAPVPILTASSAPTVNAPNCNYTEYRVSMPFISGIYGILADKMFPDLLIGANNIRIEFKLAPNNKALWLTMDPCRRIPGTVRDFAPFTGAANSIAGVAAGSGYARGGKLLATAAGIAGCCVPTTVTGAAAALGCFYSMLNCQNTNTTLAGLTPASYSVAGAAMTSAQATSGAIFPNSYIYNTASAMGEDLKGSNSYNYPGGGAAAITYQANNPGISGFDIDIKTNLPKPQYMPTAQPWTQKAFAVLNGQGAFSSFQNASYCNENAACYGTYLPSSTPQTRRCQLSSRLAIVDSNFSSAGVTAFAIRDLQYIGEQVQLDDISTSAIIQHAATSEIVVWTRGYRSFEANCDSNTQQNIILPIQIGQATALYLVFRPAAILQSPDYYSNSFCCPFTGLSFSSTSTGGLQDVTLGKAGAPPDVGGSYVVSSTLDTQNQGLFSYQLFSGTKQYPLQPIQTVSEMLVEREKSTHSLHNWSWCGTENMNLTAWDSSQASQTTSGFNFDPFLDLGFFTTFVPVAALDDQTITQNPFFSIAEVNEAITAGPRIRGIRQSPRSTGVTGNGTNQFIGVLNTFVPPIGTFFLGWDFESWTNHDDLMRTGKFLGQEQLSIRMTGCQLMSATNPIGPGSSQSVSQNVGCTAIVPHVVKLSFVPGGHMLSYY